MTMQSRQASGKQAMIQSANQAVGANAPGAGWYLTRCDTGSSLSNASPTATITNIATAITLFTGDISYLLPDGDAPYHIKVFEPGDPSVFEVMRVTDVAGDTITVDRAREGTTAQTWTTAAHLRLRFDTDIYFKVSLAAPTPATGLTISGPGIIANTDDGVLVSTQMTTSGPTYQAHVQMRHPTTGALIWLQEYSSTYGRALGAVMDGTSCCILCSAALIVVDQSDGTVIHAVDLYGELDAVLQGDTYQAGSVSSTPYMGISGGFVVGVGARDGALTSAAANYNAFNPHVWSVDLSTGAFTSSLYALTPDVGFWGASAQAIPTYSTYIDGGAFVYGVKSTSSGLSARYRWYLLDGGGTQIAAMDQFENAGVRDSYYGSAFFASNTISFFPSPGESEIVKISYPGLAILASETIPFARLASPSSAVSGGLVIGSTVLSASLINVFSPRATILVGEDYTGAVSTLSGSLDSSTKMLFLSPNYAKLRNAIDDL